MFDIPKEPERGTKSFSLTIDSIEMIETMAELYDSNPSKVVDVLVATYGPGIIQDQREKRKETA